MIITHPDLGSLMRVLGKRLIVGLACLVAACAAPVSEGPDMSVILAEAPAATLSEYGLFTDAAATQPAPRVLPYDLINPLFSDHADKTRLVFVPEGESGAYQDQDVMALPVGSVLIKSFSYAETGRIETRLLIHKASGWVGYPYIWNETRTEARYAPIGGKFEIEITNPSGAPERFAYAVPNQNQCKTCHQAGDKITPIGPKARNLGETQLLAWQARGVLTGVPGQISAVPSIVGGAGDLNDRARAYLDINCAHCHKATGSASNSGLWLGWDEDRPVRLGVGKHPTAAGRGAGALTRIIEPGASNRSIMTYRMASDRAGIAMPELGRRLVDDDGVALIADWIDEMPITIGK